MASSTTIMLQIDTFTKCARMVGIDRIMIGSDYNMDAGYPRPVEFVDTIPGLTAQERELILSGNATRMLKRKGKQR